jgi:hypothetical protein
VFPSVPASAIRNTAGLVKPWFKFTTGGFLVEASVGIDEKTREAVGDG